MDNKKMGISRSKDIKSVAHFLLALFNFLVRNIFFLFTYTISYSALPEPAHNICYKVTHRTIIHWPF